tara:strand:+ start:36308 stop:37099 length:792 start_codon:yes stop_codon:yes gene_type:complete
MTDHATTNSLTRQPSTKAHREFLYNFPIEESRRKLEGSSPEEQIQWAYKEFGANFALTTSFGIQSAILLNMVHLLKLQISPTVIWVDTGYLPHETYKYAEELINKLNINIKVVQSHISPARMEALHGKLWETKSEKDLEKYHLIRKVNPLEEAFDELNILCWASGVRGGQTRHRSSMSCLDKIRDRLSIRPLLNWTTKDVYYYMQEHNLPQHPLFHKGYSTIGDWHSSGPDSTNEKGRNTRFGGLKEECGIHLPASNGDNHKE